MHTFRKIKVVASCDIEEFETLMNEFLENRKYYIHDIKYDVIYRGEHNEKVMYSAMIMYGSAKRKAPRATSDVTEVSE